jgi:hypothetical protein
LKVYSEPSVSSKVVGALSLYEKVTRFKVDRGYAYVESTRSGVKGWVNNAQMLWRLPVASPSAGRPPTEPPTEEPAAPTPQPPQVVEPTATAAEPLPVPTSPRMPAAPKAEGTPRGVAPSIFDAY